MNNRYVWLYESTISSFQQFVINTPPSEVLSDDLAAFLRAWMVQGDGVWVCRYRYDSWLLAVQFIVDDLQCYPDSLHFWPTVEPRPEPVARAVKRFLPHSATLHGQRHDIHNFAFFAKCVEADWARRMARFNKKKQQKRLDA